MHEDDATGAGIQAVADLPAARVRRIAGAKLSAVERMRLWMSWRQAARQRLRFLPCWLASLVLHMAAIIVLGSLLVPEVDHPFLHPLLFSFAPEIAEQEQSDIPTELVQLEPSPGDAPAPQTPPPPEPADEALPAEALLAEKPLTEAEPLEPPDVAAKNVAETPPEPAPAEPEPDALRPPVGDLASLEPPQPPAPVAWPTRRVRAANFSAGGVTARGGAVPLEDELRQRQLDDVVDRFILYDIGRLRGEEGERARREFAHLGSEAIPALVRGLNKSASIHASCPVCVITSKLQEELKKSNDRGAFRYAIENIGKDVPQTATHYWRLLELMKWLNASTDALIASLQGSNRQAQHEAIERLYQEHGDLTSANRLRVALTLIGLIEDDPRARLAAHRLMVVMADGAPCPDEVLLRTNPAAAAEQWRAAWERLEIAEHMKSATTEKLIESLAVPDPMLRQAAAAAIANRPPGKLPDGNKLALARQLVRTLGDEDLAGQGYARQALSRLSEQADSAQWPAQRWQAFWNEFEREKLLEPRAASYLAMARRFEGRGQRREAVERYRKIVAEYPMSRAAGEARRRLGLPAPTSGDGSR